MTRRTEERRRRHGGRSTPQSPWIGVLALLLGAVLAAAADAQPDYARDPGTVVVRFQEIHGEIDAADAGPSVEVRGDGSARVRYPAYMRRAGDWTTRLDAAEMDRLIGLLVGAGLLDFDAAAVARAKEARAARPTAGGRPADRYVVLDASTTVIELHVGAVARTIRWQGLRGDARRYPGLAALQGLAEAQRELLHLMERPDLTRVGP